MAGPEVLMERLEVRVLSSLPEAAGRARGRLGREVALAATPAAPSIVLGYQQGSGEIDLRECGNSGVEVGRRFCAGDAFIVGRGDILFALAAAGWDGLAYREAVGAALEAVASAARAEGVEVKASRSSLLCEQRRFAGATAMRKWGSHIVCGYALLNGPIDVFAGPLMLAPKELAANYSPLAARTGKIVDPAAFTGAMVKGWAAGMGTEANAFADPGEVSEIGELAAGKYAGPRWLTIR